MKSYSFLLGLLWVTNLIYCQDDLSTHPNFNLLPTRDQCGNEIIQPFISGGTEASLGEFPWLAYLIFRFNDGVIQHDCGGILVNKRYVITAGHCLKDKTKELVTVRLGEHSNMTNPDCTADDSFCGPLIQNMNHEYFIVHENYRARTRQNDIALIRLTKNVDFNDFVKPACLPLNGEASPPGTQMTVSGWGLTETGQGSSVKLKTNLNIVSNADCNAEINKLSGLTITEEQMCAGASPGSDSCTGDSGGPLMRHFPDDDTWLSEGMVSFGHPDCDTALAPSVYVRLTKYMKWILDNMQAF